jgi:hypothetical protein
MIPTLHTPDPTSAMTQLEYLVALLSIIAGLGLTDLAQSFRELVRPQHTVRWHWLPLIWAVSTFLVAVQIWWYSFQNLQSSTQEFFLTYLFLILLLYLACAFALPDPDWERAGWTPNGSGDDLERAGDKFSLDLKAFYFSKTHRRWHFGILIVLLLADPLGLLVTLVPGVAGPNLETVVSNAIPIILLAIPLGVLIGTDRWWVHTIISVVWFVAISWATLSAILL